MRQLRENLVVQFSLASFVVVAAIALVFASVLADKIRSDAVDALVQEAIGASSERLLRVITPADLEVPMTGARYGRFHEFVQQSIVSDRTARIKLWAKDGTVIYSNDPAGVGEKFPTNESLLKALRGENATKIKIPKDPENARERFLGTLMEVYTPIVFPGAAEPQGVLEIYQYYEPTAQRISRLRGWLFGSIGVGFVVLYGGLVSIVWRGSRTIVQQRIELQLLAKDRELKNAQAQLVRAEKLASIGHLAAGVAHEVLNPLNIISGHTQLLLMHRGLDPKISEALKTVMKQVKRSANIIDNLLRFSRVRESQTRTVNLNKLIEEALALIEYDMSRDNIQIVRHLNPHVPPIMADGEQLQQTFLNLITNARDAMAEGGTLTISTSLREGNALQISFQDTGCGIPEKDLGKVFDPFFTTKPEGKGTGLGLSVCHAIIENHGGTISVESQQGKGATFVITLPITREDQQDGEDLSSR